MILGLQWRSLGYKKLSISSYLSALYMGFVVLACRVHYTIDIFAGAIAAHWSYIAAGMVAFHADKVMRKLYLKWTNETPPEPLLS